MSEVNTSKRKPYFYIVNKDRYLICDLDACDDSERTIDMSLHEIASNKNKILDKLNLFSLYVGTEKQVSMFVVYLNAFINNEFGIERLINNPTLRILLLDKELLKEVKNV